MNSDAAMPSLEPTSFELQYQLTFEGNWPTAVAFAGPDRIVAGNRDGDLFVWDLTREPAEPSEAEAKDKDRTAANIHPVRQLVGHDNGITHLIWIPGENRLVSSGLDRRICIWDLDAEPAGEAEVVLDLAQRRRKVKRDKSNEDEVLNAPGMTVATVVPETVLSDHADWITALAISADGQRMISGDDSGRTIIWDVPKRESLTEWTGHPMNGISSVAINSDGSQCFVAEFRMRRGDFDRPPAQARIYDINTKAVLVDLLEVKFPDVKTRDNSYAYGTKWHKWVGNGFVAADYSPDDRMIAVGMGGEIGEAKAHLIDASSGEEIRTVSGHKYGICDVRFSGDGNHLLTSGRDTTLKVIGVSDGKDVHSLGKSRGGQFKDWYAGIALSEDQSRVAAADIAGIIHGWRAAPLRGEKGEGRE